MLLQCWLASSCISHFLFFLSLSLFFFFFFFFFFEQGYDVDDYVDYYYVNYDFSIKS